MLQIKTKTRSKPRKTASREPRFVGKHLVVHPGVCHGKMTFQGTRVPVETILYYLATGHTFDYIHRSWPEVSAEAIQEAVLLAADAFLTQQRSKRI